MDVKMMMIRLIEFWQSYFGGHIELTYSHINMAIEILDHENLLLYLTILHFITFLCQSLTEACKFIEFCQPDRIFAAILNFHSHKNIEIEILVPENLLLQTEMNKFIEFWQPFEILAAIYFLFSGHLGPSSEMHSSDCSELNKHSG